MCVCVCIYIYMCVCVCVCICVCVGNPCALIRTFVRACWVENDHQIDVISLTLCTCLSLLCIYMHAYIHTYIHIYIYMYVYVHKCVYIAHMCVYICWYFVCCQSCFVTCVFMDPCSMYVLSSFTWTYQNWYIYPMLFQWLAILPSHKIYVYIHTHVCLYMYCVCAEYICVISRDTVNLVVFIANRCEYHKLYRNRWRNMHIRSSQEISWETHQNFEANKFWNKIISARFF